MPDKEYENWDPIEYLEEEKNKIEQHRNRRYE